MEEEKNWYIEGPISIITCGQCERQFLSWSPKKRLCPECAKENIKRASIEWRNRTFSNPDSLTVTCSVCGKRVAKTGAAQKMCRECSREAKRERSARYKGKGTQRKMKKKAKPASTEKRFQKQGWVPKSANWEPLNVKVSQELPKEPPKAKSKVRVDKLPEPPREPTYEQRPRKDPPLPRAYIRVIGNQWPPRKWERGAGY